MKTSRACALLLSLTCLCCEEPAEPQEQVVGGTNQGGESAEGGDTPRPAGERIEAGSSAGSSAGAVAPLGGGQGGEARAGQEGGQEGGAAPEAGEALGGTPAPPEADSLTGTGSFPGGTADQLILSNAPVPCRQLSAISPYLPDEAGHQVAALISPPRYPFRVQMLEYSLEEPPDIPSCKSELAHELTLSVLSAGQAPPAQPAQEARAHITLSSAEASEPTERRVIIQLLEEPITLVDGERLLVSIPLIAEGDEHLCMSVCDTEQASPGSALWSNSAAPPFNWVELSSFGLTSEPIIRVIGAVVE